MSVFTRCGIECSGSEVPINVGDGSIALNLVHDSFNSSGTTPSTGKCFECLRDQEDEPGRQRRVLRKWPTARSDPLRRGSPLREPACDHESMRANVYGGCGVSCSVASTPPDAPRITGPLTC